MTFEEKDWEDLRQRLIQMQNAVLEGFKSRPRSLDSDSRIAKTVAEDVIFQIDLETEHLLLQWFESNWPTHFPVELVMEGLDHGTTFPLQTPIEETVLKMIIDPIDGTRMIMYDKRSAWCLAGLAPQKGRKTARVVDERWRAMHAG